MTKICFFAGNINFGGGTERSLTLVTNELVRRGYSVSIVNLWGGDKSFFSIAPEIHVDALFEQKVSFLGNFFQTVWRLRKFVQQHEFDVLVSVESSQSLFALPATCFMPVVNINWEHFNCTVDLGFFPRRIARRLAARFSERIIVLTERDKTLWERRLKPKAPVQVIPNALSFSIEDRAVAVREKIVLAVGRFTYQKGFDLLLESWSFARKDLDRDWKLWIVGDGEERDSLNALVERYDLVDSVELFGPTTNIAEFYSRAKWYCLSSRFEGLPMVLLEASAWGLPIISFDCNTGPAEIVTDGWSGILCPPGSATALARALVSGLSMAEHEYDQLAKNSIKVADRFVLPRIADLWVSLLKDL